ncbi:MAG: DUF1207 domain-containing protein [Proteobacteria bacterium]|nr:DUF1207 domain-containing protein [Pseudomonadota bacterium]NDC23167.1 DUF1207 domain-containing protein [Pseudomonadota bacterium]NDD03378.1 DUF1207 domain-containing protein [Pseudomonadota bacterium]NDG25618.1 DUF1207 domain-containing protein [Pseudomonadota bacterium]
MKKLILILNLFFLVPYNWAFEQLGLELLPSKRPFRLTFADPREIRMALSFQGSSGINASIGNYFSLLGIKPVSEGLQPDWIAHAGLEGAGYFTMRQADSRFPLETADGLIGTYFEGASGPFQGQLRFTHISAHLADGSSGVPIAYSREFISLRVGYVPGEELQVYSGLQVLVNTVPKVEPWALQLGGNFFLPGQSNLTPFVSADLKWRQESPENPAIHLLMGLALNNPPQAFRSFRFYYAYFTGADPRGQFYNQVVTTHSVGIDMQI